MYGPLELSGSDRFIDLTLAEHDDALALYAAAVSNQVRLLLELVPDTPAYEASLDTLSRLLTLRRAHQLRRMEVEDN